jgi:hypothetical protein
MFEILGAIIGGLMGILIPILLMVLIAIFGDKDTVAGSGALSFLPIALIPMGIVVGWKVGRFIRYIRNSRRP